MNRQKKCGQHPELQDYGGKPAVLNIDRLAGMNPNFRTALWTGEHLQVTLMNIRAGGEIGLECHAEVDQFIRIESGTALVMMGECQEHLNYRQRANSANAILIPAGTWHNIINTGKCPLRVYSIYAPPQHPFGTVHATAEIARESEHH